MRAVTEEDVNAIVAFIRDSVKGSGSNGVILGLSGGLDSAVVAKLSVMALGRDKVTAVAMPSSPVGINDAEDARLFASSLGVGFQLIQIEKAVKELSDSIPGDDGPTDMGNLSARCRMSILYNIARKKHLLVIGTSNRSELMLGYFTKYGDGACDLMPLYYHFKTQVRQMASLISIPEEIISKPPSAGFWDGQTDEQEMGMTYETLDPILDLIDIETPIQQICSATGQPEQTVLKVIGAVEASEHKRHLPSRP